MKPPSVSQTRRPRLATRSLAAGIALLMLQTSAITVAETGEPTPAASSETTAEPDLAASLMNPRDAVAPGSISIRGMLTNRGGPAPATQAELVTAFGSGRTTRTLEIPPLRAGQDYPVEVALEVPGGTTRISLLADPARIVAERDEANNLASTWVRRPYDGPAPATRPILFEKYDGTTVKPSSTEFRFDADRFTLNATLPAGAPVRILVHRAWLESRLPNAALQDARLVESERDGQFYHEATVPEGGAVSLAFATFEPRIGSSLFGQGSLDSVLLDERPMGVRVSALPIYEPVPRTLETPNGTIESEGEPRPFLALAFEDGDPSGQPVWFNKDWLEGYGVTRPEFAQEDGEEVPAEDRGSHVLARPAHFSILHVFNSNAEAFDLVSNQSASAVHFTNSTPEGGRIRILSQKQDTLDESMVRDFIPHAQYTVSASFALEKKGRFQAMYPLGIGNRADRVSPAPGDHWHAPKSIGFFYYSNDTGTFPEIRAQYATPAGGNVVLWTWVAGSDTPWSVGLEIHVDRDRATLELRENTGQLGVCGLGPCSASVAKNELSLADFDVVFVGTEEGEPDVPDVEAIGFVDNVAVVTVEGNWLPEEFESDSTTTFSFSGSAECCANGVLQLTSETPNQVGRGTYRAELPGTRFSAEFRYRIGPDASGADGLVFMFYKNFSYEPAGGENLGFQDTDTSSVLGHEGYGLELDGKLNAWQGDPSDDHVSILKDRANNQLWHVNNKTYPDGAWHTMNLEVFESKARVYNDGLYLGVKNLGTVNYAYTGIGFAAATSATYNYHEIDYLRVSVPESLIGTPVEPHPLTDGRPELDVKAEATWEVNPTQILSQISQGQSPAFSFGNFGSHAVQLQEISLFDGPGMIYFLDDQENVIGQQAITIKTYQGQVAGEPDSEAAISIDSNGVYGTIDAFGTRFNYNPLSDTPLPPNTVAQNRVTWIQAYGGQPELPVQVPPETTSADGSGPGADLMAAAAAAANGTVLPYADYEYRKKHRDYYNRIVAAFNKEYNMWYNQVGIRIKLYAVFASRDYGSGNMDCNPALRYFHDVHSLISGVDAYQLFTGWNFAKCDGVANIYYPYSPGVMARPGWRDSLVEAHDHVWWDTYDPDEADDLGLISGQEIAHNWGEPDHPQTKIWYCCWYYRYNIMAGGTDEDSRVFRFTGTSEARIETATSGRL